jgi:ABC-2 type transport system permease protein
MISYYLIVLIIDALTGVVDDDWQVAADIREGNISQFLLKPINYLYYRLCLYGAGRLVYASVAAIPIALFLLFYRGSLYIPANGLTWVCFGVSLLMAAMLQFLISYTMALLAFWLLEVSTLILMLFALEYLAGGHMFPLDLLPAWIATLLAWTPFPYELYLPAGIYLEQITGMAMVKGLGLQALWVLIIYAIAQGVWQRGVKHYSAFGG